MKDNLTTKLIVGAVSKSLTLNWTEKTSEFIYDGKPVTRYRGTVVTPLGLIEVTQPVNGRCTFASWPYMVNETQYGLLVSGRQKVECNSIEEAKQKCTDGWVVFRDSCFNL